MAEPRSALIVGAGIGGLAAGVALRQAGWQVRIFERAAHPRELGFALLLASNAVASLHRLGLAQSVIAGGSVVEGGVIHGSEGRVLRRFDLARVRHLLSHPPVVVLRPVLHGALLVAVGDGTLMLNSEARGCAIDDGKPVLQLADGRRATGDVLIGADGLRSVIRRALHADDPPPRASGLWAVRGVAHGVEAAAVGRHADQYFGRGIEGGIARAGERAVYWYLSVRDGRIGGSSDPREIADRCAGEFDGRFRAIVSATRDEDLRLDELVDRDSVAEWGRGPVTLLGDAAHPMLPHAGQGAAQALEDAVAIGRALADAADVDAALRRYERLRAPRTRAIASLARRNARVASIDSAAGRWLRDLAIRLVPASVFLKAYVEFGSPPPLDQ